MRKKLRATRAVNRNRCRMAVRVYPVVEADEQRRASFKVIVHPARYLSFRRASCPAALDPHVRSVRFLRRRAPRGPKALRHANVHNERKRLRKKCPRPFCPHGTRPSFCPPRSRSAAAASLTAMKRPDAREPARRDGAEVAAKRGADVAQARHMKGRAVRIERTLYMQPALISPGFRRPRRMKLGRAEWKKSFLFISAAPSRVFYASSQMAALHRGTKGINRTARNRRAVFFCLVSFLRCFAFTTRLARSSGVKENVRLRAAEETSHSGELERRVFETNGASFQRRDVV